MGGEPVRVKEGKVGDPRVISSSSWAGRQEGKLGASFLEGGKGSGFLGGMNFPEDPGNEGRFTDAWILRESAKGWNTPGAEAIRCLLLREDPIFAVGNPAAQRDEYDLAVPMVAEALGRCGDYKTLRGELRRIFARTVGTFEAGTVFRYTKLAKELVRIRDETTSPQ